MLMHPKTALNIEHYIAFPGSGLIITGEKGSGKQFIAQHISDAFLSSDEYRISLDVAHEKVGIAEVRELQKTLTLLTPGQKKVRRIVTINGFDLLGHEAQNALLKTLEEPPLDTLLLLLVEHNDQVLPTIRSRVQLIKVYPLSDEYVREQLGSAHNKSDLDKAYSLSGGQAGLLVALLDQSSKHSLANAVKEAKELLMMDKIERLGAVDKIIKNKELSTADFLDGLLRILRASQSNAVNSTQRDAADMQKATQRIRCTLDAINDLKAGTQQKLVLTRLFLEL